MSSLQEQIEALEAKKAEVAAQEGLDPTERKRTLSKIRRQLRSLKKQDGSYVPRQRSSTADGKKKKSRKPRGSAGGQSIKRLPSRKDEVQFYKKLQKALKKKKLKIVSDTSVGKLPVYAFSGVLIIDYHLRTGHTIEETAQAMLTKFDSAWDDAPPAEWFCVLNRKANPLFGFGPVRGQDLPKGGKI